MLEFLINNVAGKTCNFIKRRLQHRCFPMNIAKFLSTTSFIEHLWRLLLNIWNDDKLKLPDVTPAFKKERRTLLKSYRPVNVLQDIWMNNAKINQIILSSTLMPYLYGCKKGYSTQTALIILPKKWQTYDNNSAGNWMFKVKDRNTRTMCEICSKLTIKTPERRRWCYC